MPHPPTPDPGPPGPPDPGPSRPPDPLDALLAPDRPPPGRLPPWVETVRRRIGLDVRVGAWIAALVVAVVAGAWLLRPGPAAVEETLPMATTASAAPGASTPGSPSESPVAGPPPSAGATTPTEVVVHAAGAVVRPGVYTLDVAARVDDLVRAAGGLAPDADGARINLAAPLADGARVYVPKVGEEAPPVVAAGAPPAPGSPDAGTAGPSAGPAAPIDLNTASEAELDELPGVGPSIAAAIVTFREQNGGFTSVEDLLDVRGIGEARLAEIRPLVTV